MSAPSRNRSLSPNFQFLLVILVFISPQAFAGPEGGEVTGGTAQ
ncbi:hypothetical protein TDB9533_04778 [Thalassocella blandensis]|nr:hypothetical protein TDB9533_04778 [Thalassocella blandensis]